MPLEWYELQELPEGAAMSAVMAILSGLFLVPDIDAVRAMPVSHAEDIFLANVLHDPIQSLTVGPWPFAGIATVALYGVTESDANTCTLTSWRVTITDSMDRFEYLRKEGEDKLHPPVKEVALKKGNACPSTGYVTLQSGVDSRLAIYALTVLERLRVGKGLSGVRCTDYTDTNLCRSNSNITAELRRDNSIDVHFNTFSNTVDIQLRGEHGYATDIAIDRRTGQVMSIDRELLPPT